MKCTTTAIIMLMHPMYLQVCSPNTFEQKMQLLWLSTATIQTPNVFSLLTELAERRPTVCVCVRVVCFIGLGQLASAGWCCREQCPHGVDLDLGRAHCGCQFCSYCSPSDFLDAEVMQPLERYVRCSLVLTCQTQVNSVRRRSTCQAK